MFLAVAKILREMYIDTSRIDAEGNLDAALTTDSAKNNPTPYFLGNCEERISAEAAHGKTAGQGQYFIIPPAVNSIGQVAPTCTEVTQLKEQLGVFAFKTMEENVIFGPVMHFAVSPSEMGIWFDVGRLEDNLIFKKLMTIL